MKKNKVERFEIAKIHRREIHGAPYNPRDIDDEARKGLKKELDDFGLLGPIIVNKRSLEKGWEGEDIGFKTIVAGHQRIDIQDQIMRTDDYECTVSLVDLTQREEIRANTLLNNTSVMGKWNAEKLSELTLLIPDLDFKADLGFAQVDLEVMFAGMDGFEHLAPAFAPKTEAEIDDIDELEQMRNRDNFKAAKKKLREKIKNQESSGGDTWEIKKDDYILSFVFETNRDKHEMMMRLKKPIKETHLRATVLYDIAQGKYNLKDPIKVLERNE